MRKVIENKAYEIGWLLCVVGPWGFLFFTDSRMLSRVVLNDVAFANAINIVLVIWLVIYLATRYVLSRPSIVQSVLIFLGCTSLLLALVNGVPTATAGQLFLGYIGAAVAWTFLTDGVPPRFIAIVFVCLLFVHGIFCFSTALALFPYSEHLDFVLSELGDREITSISSVRRVGLFTAPGYLCCYSSLCVGLTSIYWVRRGGLTWLVAFGASIGVGILSGNRIFLGVIALFPIVAYLTCRKRDNCVRRVLTLSTAVIGMSLAIFLFNQEAVTYNFITRLSEESVLNDVSDRTFNAVGFTQAIEAFVDAPLMGAFTSGPDGGWAVQGRGGLLRPHNSLAYILGTRGLVIAVPLGVLMFLAGGQVIRRWLPRNRTRPREPELYDTAPFIGALVLGLIPTVTDPLIEFPPLLICLSVVLWAKAGDSVHRNVNDANLRGQLIQGG